MKLERPLIWVINNHKKLSCNKIELKRCTTADKRWNFEEELSPSSLDNLAMHLPRLPISSYAISLNGPSLMSQVSRHTAAANHLKSS